MTSNTKSDKIKSLVNIDQNTEYRIEKIISRRVRNGVKQARVRWQGYDPSQDTWINASEVRSLQS